ncbi:hypothetical protein [Erwinia sp. 9145]|uniref:hypothetical protein n=1 Tax=Erwinia sp. 9145 TaxID=1500895 RepID=UPI000551DC67|nr:hypothetical protein [Erwinia sp. 9145]
MIPTILPAIFLATDLSQQRQRLLAGLLDLPLLLFTLREVRWQGDNSAWGKLLREAPLKGPVYPQNLRMQGQYPDRDKFVGNKFEQRASAGPGGASLMDEASIRGFIILCSGTKIRTADGSRSRTR